MTKTNKDIKFAILAVDIVLFTVKDGRTYVRLINVNRPPFYNNAPGLPGGLIHPSETADQAAIRHLRFKTGMKSSEVYLEQLYTFSEVKRDPRGRVVAVAYLGLTPWEKLGAKARESTDQTWWQEINKTGKLAYDHNEILDTAIKRLTSRITYTTLISKVIPKEFTLTDLEKTYEIILGHDIDKRNFRKKIKKLGMLKLLPRKRIGQKYRPAKLYSFISNKVLNIEVV